jgi:hypothetical protein
LTGSTTWTETEGVTMVQKAWDGRGNLAVLVSPGSARSGQAFSADGGQTWETIWINTYTRVPGTNDEKDGSGKKH